MGWFDIRKIIFVVCIVAAGFPLVRHWQRTLPDRYSAETFRERREQAVLSEEERRLNALGADDTELFHRLRNETPEDAVIALYLPVRQHNILRVRKLMNSLYPRHATFWAQVASHFYENPDELGPHCFVVNFAKDKKFPTQEFFDKIGETDDYVLWRYRGTP